MAFDETLVDKGALFYDTSDGSTPPPVGDGVTYSNALGWQSPEGNFYGQERWVRDWYSAVYWDGLDYQILEVDGETTSIDLLPIPGATNPNTGLPYGPRQSFEMWATPRPNWPPSDLEVYDGRMKDFWWWDVDTQSWKELEWFWECDGENELPRPGVKIGAAHSLVYHNIKVMWNGYYWQRFALEMIDGGERVDALEGLAELTSGQIDTIANSHNTLLASYLGDTNTGDTLLDAIAVEKAGMLEQLNSVSSDLILSEFEADSLSAEFDLLTIGYNSIVDAANDVSVSTAAISTAYDNLHTGLDTTWLDQTYPATLASGDRAALQALLQEYEEHRFLTQTAINSALATGISASAINDLRLTIYNGFVPGWTPDLEMAYISNNELGLKPKTVVGETADETAVRTQLAKILEKSSVHIYTPVLDYTTPGGVVTLDLSEIVELNTTASYNVYLANQHEDFATSIYDYRGKLFCSTVTPSDNLWINDGDFDAILIGTVETQTESGKIVFEHEYGTSLVSRESDVKETFREYSDFDLKYTDEDTITLERIYGTYGQIYVPESLYYIGESKEVTTSDWTVLVNVDNTLSLDTEGVVADTLYYAYIGADTDIYNFNALAGITPDRPLHPGEAGYNADKDFRLDIFLSTQIPDNMRLAETYYGYWARHIGQVRTDGTGKFIYSGGVSAIRQPTLQPEYFDGLAEISLQDVSTTTFKVVRKRGTSGIVMVGAKGVLTYDSDNPLVHAVTTSDTVYTYNEATPSSPLSSTSTIFDVYIGRSLHLYLANDRPCWGSLADRTFLCDEAPTDAYLSQNFPGNNARWIAEIRLVAGACGTDLVTNGNFDDGDDWVSTGWTYSASNLNMAHNTGNTTSLEQSSMTVVAGGTYELMFVTSAVGVGTITPKIGNTNGTAVTSAGLQTQYIIAANTNVLKFVPTTTFNGAIDTVGCKKVEHGAFIGSYIVDSIAKSFPYIDDTIVSSATAWSSQKILQVINEALGVSGTTSVLNSQKTGGLNLRLEYVNTTTIRLIPASGQDSYVVFPDLSFRTIPAAGISLTVSGTANTRYYVYLSASSFTMSTAPPDGFYIKLEALGMAHLQVGDICMTSTNTMSGAWNVCSSHQEPTREWSAAVNAASVSINMPGFVVSKRAIANRYTNAISITGQAFYYYCPGGPGYTCYSYSGYGTLTTVGTLAITANNNPWTGWITGTLVVDFSTGTPVFPDTYNNEILTTFNTFCSSSISVTASCIRVPVSGDYAWVDVSARAGIITVIRSQT